MKTSHFLLAALTLLLPATAVVTPLPITQENSTRALRVEREEAPDGPGFHYRIHSIDWEGQQKQTQHFHSTHRYAQGYASGGTLVLTNSGAQNEKLMSLAVVDAGKDSVLEHELLFHLNEHSCGGTAYWSGVDEEGNPTGGRYSCTHWHGAPGHVGAQGWSNGDAHIRLQLGAQTHKHCGFCWSYDASSGRTHLYNVRRAEKDKPLPPQRSRHLPLRPADQATASAPAPLPAHAPAEAAAVRQFIAQHPALLFGRLRYNKGNEKDDCGRPELYVHPALHALSHEVWMMMEDDSTAQVEQLAESQPGGMWVLLRYWPEELRTYEPGSPAFLLGVREDDILPLPGGTDSLQHLLDCLPELREDLPLRPEMQGSWDWD